MKNRKMMRITTVAMAAVMTATLIGCSGSAAAPAPAEPAQTEAATSPIFPKGVYLNYAVEAENPEKSYFYVFDSEETGHTDDGTVGIGVPFACKQEDGSVSFSFGGDDGIWDVLTVDSVENGIVKGHFEDGLELVFEPVAGVDPEGFDAQNYLSEAAGGDLIYKAANGWTVKYDPKLFTINGGGPEVSFVYTGESAGTNMITATYNVDKDAKTAIADLAKSWGDKATTSEGIFPGTEDVTGYWATLPPEKEGSGLYSTAIARDYMDGYLMFELTGHNGEDEEANMAVSDALAGIIDSIEFVTLNFPDEYKTKDFYVFVMMNFYTDYKLIDIMD